MSDLGNVWPPVPIRTDRLLLRAACADDRSAVIELFASEEVGRYVGGARPRTELEQVVPEAPGQRPGFFAVEREGTTLGTVTLDPRAEHHPHPDALDLGYLFLPAHWGHGYAAEAVAGVLDWLAAVRPGGRVLVTTQTANVRSLRLAVRLGFTEIERFTEHGAEQWLGGRGALSGDGRAATR
ncbi:GNAT family N-acetyltransferase [Nocardioides sp. LML1-1-1.1]|uniref:GNAT family N-acetyltransferase n=1 Tax=Nocardioides sp. LML1-1-1.1 TaxID=3135248 RepID=UPI003420FD8B